MYGARTPQDSATNSLRSKDLWVICRKRNKQQQTTLCLLVCLTLPKLKCALPLSCSTVSAIQDNTALVMFECFDPRDLCNFNLRNFRSPSRKHTEISLWYTIVELQRRPHLCKLTCKLLPPPIYVCLCMYDYICPQDKHVPIVVKQIC